jgi:hypothetical protein
VLGTRPVLIALAVLVAAQLTFTFAPFMHDIFDSRPLGIRDGILILVIGLALMTILELEKAVFRRSRP